MTPTRKTRHGFTLVELLVVIAIIALLLAMLLPALKKARGLAQDVVCKSNLHSIGTALLMYASDNKGLLPMAWAGQPYWNGWQSMMYAYITPRRSSTDGNVYHNVSGAVFVCPTTPTEWGFPADKITRSYSATSAFFYRDSESNRQNGLNAKRSQRLNFYSRPSETVGVADGHQQTGNFVGPWSWGAIPYWKFPDFPGALWQDYIDLRHLDHCNGLYFDAHVASQELGDITLRNWHGYWN